jgi:hypothetical protein
MASPLTLEIRLILACARTDPDVEHVRDLVERGPDWQAIVRKAESWGLVPLVYASLRQAAPSDQVPRSVMDCLRHLYRRDTIYGVAKRELLRATLVRFAEASVPVIVRRGAALAALVYPSPTSRLIGDIDLLVRGHDLDRADELLRDTREAAAGIPYLAPRGFALLEVRDHLWDPPGAAGGLAAGVRIPIEDFWQRARHVRIESVDALAFCPEDLILDLALHLAKTDGLVGHVRTLCDIGETCRRYGDAIDWGQLVTRAEECRAGKALYCAVRLARDLLVADVPTDILTAPRASLGQWRLEDRFVAAARDAIFLDDEATDRPAPPVATATSGAGSPGSAEPQSSLEAARSEAPGSGASRRLGESRPLQTAQAERLVHTSGEVAVTYNQEGASDGVGAQLQRIYGLYALSRALGIKYVHTPLGQVRYQGLMPMLTGATDPDFVARYNAFFSLPSDAFDLEGCERVRIHNLDRVTVERYWEQASATGRPILLQTLLPFAYTDEHPAAYRALHAVSPYRSHRPAGPVRVCIHLRRGDNLPDKRGRWLPNSYYLRICGLILETLRRQSAPFGVRIHTEVPPRPYTIYPGTPGLYFVPEGPVTLDPARYALEEFEALPNLEVVLNAEPQEALDDFATADVLILSASSFGYLGGMLNPHGLVVFAPFTWNQPLPDWLVADEQGNVNPAEVATRIADLLRRRG